MKKYLLVIFILILAVSCTKKEVKKPSSVTGELASGITYVTRKLDNKDIVVSIINNNTKDVKLDVKLTLYDASGKIIDDEDEDIKSATSNEEHVVIFDDLDNYSDYSLDIKVESADTVSNYPDLVITPSNDGDNVTVKVVNKLDQKIDEVNLYILFYVKGEIITYRQLDIDDLDGKEEKNIKFKIDSLFEKFDNYKVKPEEVYIEK